MRPMPAQVAKPTLRPVERRGGVELLQQGLLGGGLLLNHAQPRLHRVQPGRHRGVATLQRYVVALCLSEAAVATAAAVAAETKAARAG